MADPYQSQVAPQAADYSGASPEAFGAAVGQGFEQAGESLQHMGEQKRALDRDQAAASAGVALAQASSDLDKAAIDARTKAAPGGAGHTDAITQLVDQRAQQDLGAIKDPVVRREFTQRWADLKSNIVDREYGWEAGQRVDKLVSDVDNTGTILANGQATNPNAPGLDLSLKTVATQINNMAIPADKKTDLIRQQQRKIVLGYGNGLTTTNPRLLVGDAAAGTKGILDAGVLNSYLQPEDIDKLRSAADIEIRREEVEKRQKFDQAKAAWLETKQTLVERVNQGDPTLKDSDFADVSAGAKIFGDTSSGLQLEDLQSKFDVVKETKGWTPATWHANINALEAKDATGKISQPEKLRLNHLLELAPASISRFNSDPAAAASADGNPPPPIDFTESDPNKLQAEAQARSQWARAYQSATGLTYTPYLTNDELTQFKAQAQSGPAGEIAAASTLRETFGAAAAGQIATKIDPGNQDLALMVGLHPRMASLYKLGVEALKRNPKLAGVDQTDSDQMREIFAQYYPAIPPELRTPIWNAARNIMAGRADEVGYSQMSGDYLAAEFPRFIRYAMGQQGESGSGGVLQWHSFDGTPGYVWLPRTMTGAEATSRLNKASAADWVKAGGQPYYMGPSGKLTPMTQAQISRFSNYQIETARPPGGNVTPGIYQLRGSDGGHVVDKNGKPWTFDIRTLP